jgi:hypothetical protein
MRCGPICRIGGEHHERSPFIPRLIVSSLVWLLIFAVIEPLSWATVD